MSTWESSKIENMCKKSIVEMMQNLPKAAKVKITAILIILPIITILSTLVYFYNGILNLRQSNQVTSDYLKGVKTELIYSIILENSNKCQFQTDSAKEKIIEGLKLVYNDNTDAMKADFLSADTRTPFYRILSQNIKNKQTNAKSSDNRMVVATKNGILIDNSLAHYKDSFTTWEELKKRAINPDILAKAYLNIINQNNRLVVVNEVKRVDSPELHSANELQLKNLVNHYIDSDNFEELMEYSIVSVSYIYDTKDIFGVNDIDSGVRNDNNKLYIIQFSSIRGIMESNPEYLKSIDKCDHIINHQKDHIDSTVQVQMIISIIILLLQIACFIGIWYLSEYYVKCSAIIDIENKLNRTKQQ